MSYAWQNWLGWLVVGIAAITHGLAENGIRVPFFSQIPAIQA
jgi:hypothetical protein